jgi:hypothetical protein
MNKEISLLKSQQMKSKSDFLKFKFKSKAKVVQSELKPSESRTSVLEQMLQDCCTQGEILKSNLAV